ncbi:MAG: VOC family protein [Asticcacaulis sp.]
MPAVTPFLMFNAPMTQVVAYYATVFGNDAKIIVDGTGGGAAFELCGQKFNAYNGGERFTFSEGVSFMITVTTQEEIDYFWDALSADGGKPLACGWVRDRFGLNWQVVPDCLGRYLSDPVPEKSGPAMQALLAMGKIDLGILTAAYEGGKNT